MTVTHSFSACCDGQTQIHPEHRGAADQPGGRDHADGGGPAALLLRGLRVSLQPGAQLHVRDGVFTGARSGSAAARIHPEQKDLEADDGAVPAQKPAVALEEGGGDPGCAHPDHHCCAAGPLSLDRRGSAERELL